MAREVNQVLWGQWRQRMRRQLASGLSIAEFCRTEGVSPHSFYVWKRKLGETASARHSSRGGERTRRFWKRRGVVQPRRGQGQASACLGGVAHPAEFLQLPVTAVRPSPWIELALADGTVVRLPQQNLAALVSVLRVLRGEDVDLSGAESLHA
jgi:transposase-like protein